MSHDDRRSSPAHSLPPPPSPPLSGDEVMVVHTRARELLIWLVPHVSGWPREHRHTVTAHVVTLSMQTHDTLIAARHGTPAQRTESLRQADIHLDQLRQYLQLAWQWRWMSDGQYQHVSRLTAELGRLIGGWRRAQRGG